jgi:hypothetical protein
MVKRETRKKAKWERHPASRKNGELFIFWPVMRKKYLNKFFKVLHIECPLGLGPMGNGTQK